MNKTYTIDNEGGKMEEWPSPELAQEPNDLLDESIEFGASKTPVDSTHIDMAGDANTLRGELGNSHVEVLPEKIPAEEPPLGPEDAHEMMETLEQNSPSIPVASQENPIEAEIGEIREKIERAATEIEQGAYTDAQKTELGLVLKTLTERLVEIMKRKESAPETETRDELNTLAEESKTLGTPEWISRFIAKEDTVGKPKTEVEAQFQKDFAFAQEDLQNIVTKIETPEGEKTVRFSDLTEGQQLLLLENLKGFAIDNAKEQALKNFTEEEKEKYDRSGFIKKAFLSFTKTYRRAVDMSQIEKDILAKPELDKGTYTEVLQEMLGMASEAPEAEWKDGKLQVNFALEKDFDINLEKIKRGDAVRGFNEVAGKFAKIPAEWAYSTKESEKKQYEEARTSYADARGQLLNLKAEAGKEDEALTYAASLDKKVQFSQLFNTNPDVEKVFSETKDKNAFWEGIKAIGTERGKLLFMGKALRTAGMAVGTVVAFGSGLGAPLAVALAGGFAGGALSGGIIGRYMAGKRAAQEIEDKKNLAEIGVLDQSNKKEFRSAKETKMVRKEDNGEGQEIGVGLADKVSYAIDRVLGAETGEEKEKLLAVLADRMYYTEKKLALGVVNFGEGKEGFKSRYELLSALAKARTLHEMNEPETNEKIEKKIDEILGAQGSRIATAEKDFTSQRTRQGMKYGILLGGTFGAIASSIVHAHADTIITQTEAPSSAPEALTPMTDNSILETVTPNIAQVSRNPLIDEILQKINLAKAAENIPTMKSAPSVVSAPSFAEEQVPNTGGVIFDSPPEGGVSAIEASTPVAPSTTAVTPENTESTIGPEALKLPKDALPQPPLGFSENHEGTFIPEAVTLSKGTFQMPRGYSVAQALNDLPPEGGTTTIEAITPVAKTAEDLFPRSEFGFSADHPGTFVEEAVKVPEEAIPESTGRSAAEMLSPRESAIEKSLTELGQTYTVKQGDNVWNIIKTKLLNNEEFSKLEPRRQNFIIDSLKDKITRMTPAELREIGIKNDPNRIYPGDELKFGKIFNNSEELVKAFNHAEAMKESVEEAVRIEPTQPIESTHASEIATHPKTAPDTRPERLFAPKTIDSPNDWGLRPNEALGYEVEKPSESMGENIVPEANHIDAFSIPTKEVPAHYIDAILQGMHDARPEISDSFYDTKVKDFLASHNNDMRELDRIFHIEGVKTPAYPNAEILNGDIKTYFARVVMEAEGEHQGAHVTDIGSVPETHTAPSIANFHTTLNTWRILTDDVKNYIVAIDGQVAKNMNDAAWENMRKLPTNDVLGDVKNDGIIQRVQFLQSKVDVAHHPDLQIAGKETLEHYIARLAKELSWLKNPPEIPKNL